MIKSRSKRFKEIEECIMEQLTEICFISIIKHILNIKWCHLLETHINVDGSGLLSAIFVQV